MIIIYLTQHMNIFLINCSNEGAREFQSSSSSQKHFLLRYIDSTATPREAATVASTKTKQASAFKCWYSFLLSIGIGKIYIEELSKFQQNIFM